MLFDCESFFFFILSLYYSLEFELQGKATRKGFSASSDVRHCS